MSEVPVVDIPGDSGKRARHSGVEWSSPLVLHKFPLEAHLTRRLLFIFFALFLVCAMIDAPLPVVAKKKATPPPPPPPDPDCNVTYDGYTRHIAFSNYVWAVKDHGKTQAGPGPNLFSDSTDSVWVDPDGRLHMRIRKSRGRWYAAEVINTCSLGYGTYRFYLNNEVHELDPNIVLGLFTWSDDPAFEHRELDIEVARWGDPANDNGQFVVQPYHLPGHIFRFAWPAGAPQSTHSFVWGNGSASFSSQIGHFDPADPAPVIVGSYDFFDAIPEPGDENPRINLWLTQGNAPTDRREAEVIIDRFEFVPAI